MGTSKQQSNGPLYSNTVISRDVNKAGSLKAKARKFGLVAKAKA